MNVIRPGLCLLCFYPEVLEVQGVPRGAGVAQDGLHVEEAAAAGALDQSEVSIVTLHQSQLTWTQAACSSGGRLLLLGGDTAVDRGSRSGLDQSEVSIVPLHQSEVSIVTIHQSEVSIVPLHQSQLT